MTTATVYSIQIIVTLDSGRRYDVELHRGEVYSVHAIVKGRNRTYLRNAWDMAYGRPPGIAAAAAIKAAKALYARLEG